MNFDATKQIKTFNVLARIFTEMINDMTSGLTYQSLVVICSAAIISLFVCGKLSCGRHGDGKITVSMGDAEH